MDSTFLGLEIGKRSLMSHQQGLKVIGHNLANADNENYSRQRVILDTVDPLYRADLARVHRPGQVGQGVKVAEVRRERDIYLDKRIYNEVGKFEYWKANDFHLNDIESIYNALGEINLQEKMDIFWSAWQELANNPSEAAVREELVQKSLMLTSDFRDKYRKFSELRHEINEKIIHEVNTVNDLSKQVAELNQAIFNSMTVGDNPNDLLDRRDAMIEKLSAFGEVKVNFRDPDEMMVFFGGRILVQGYKVNRLSLDHDSANEGFMKVSWEINGDRFDFEGGERGSIIAHLQARDTILIREINKLDTIATNLMVGVNSLHQKGFDEFGRKGGEFFTFHPATVEGNGNADVNADGVLESSLIYQVRGGSRFSSKDILGSFGEITLQSLSNEPITVTYSAYETVEDLIERINLSDSTVSAYLDEEGYFNLKSRSYSELYPFSIEQISDTGDFLSNVAQVMSVPGGNFTNNILSASEGLHPNAQFVRTPIKRVSSWIEIDKKFISNADLIAARMGIDYDATRGTEIPKGKNNGIIASEISKLRHDKTLFDRKDNFNEYYLAAVSQVGSELSHAKLEMDKYENITGSLKEFRQAYSGVNIDEELANMVALQNGYQAGAKVIKLMDEMLKTVIGLVG